MEYPNTIHNIQTFLGCALSITDRCSAVVMRHTFRFDAYPDLHVDTIPCYHVVSTIKLLNIIAIENSRCLRNRSELLAHDHMHHMIHFYPVLFKKTDLLQDFLVPWFILRVLVHHVLHRPHCPSWFFFSFRWPRQYD
jgi:hypothetical protein